MALSRRKKLALGVGGLFVVLAGTFLAGVMLLTDERLTAQTAALLNKHLSGHFDVERVHYGFPAHIAIDDLRARSPSGTPVLAVQRVRVEARLLPLLIGRLVVDDLSVDGIRADIIAAAGKDEKSAFVDTFVPDFELPKLRNISTPVRLDIRRLRVDDGDIVFQDAQGEKIRLRHMTVKDANVLMDGDVLHASLTWQCDASATSPEATFDESRAAARIEDARARFSEAAMGVGMLTADFPGFTCEIGGDTQFAQSGDIEADARGKITLDTRTFLPKVHKLDAAKEMVQGHTTLRFTAKHSGKKGNAQLALVDPSLRIRDLPLEALSASLSHENRTVTIDAFRLDLGKGHIEAHGHLALGDDPNIPLADHDLTFKAHAMAVQQLARPWVSLPSLLPKAVSFAITSKGRALWPPTSQVDLDIVPEGLPGENWPGLPKAMEFRGRFFTHPDLLEILKLEAYIDKVPDFAIQGAVPLREQGIFDLIHELHGPFPKSRLQRIPVAPTNKRPS